MKRPSILFFFTILFLSFAPLAQAHLLATDGSIGAVLHVDPNDQPIAGSQASFFFEFKDKENTFDPTHCDCTFSVAEGGKTIFSQPLFQNAPSPSLTNASVFYTFPQKDVYQVKVVGKPTTPNGFQPFTLTWNFRVDQTANTSTQQSSFWATHMVHIIIAAVGIVALILLFLQNKLSKKRPTKGGEKKHEEKNNSTVY